MLQFPAKRKDQFDDAPHAPGPLSVSPNRYDGSSANFVGPIGQQAIQPSYFEWSKLFEKLYQNRSTYCEVYASSFLGKHREKLSREIRRFADHCRATRVPPRQWPPDTCNVPQAKIHRLKTVPPFLIQTTSWAYALRIPLSSDLMSPNLGA